jgi:hypothetical protein
MSWVMMDIYIILIKLNNIIKNEYHLAKWPLYLHKCKFTVLSRNMTEVKVVLNKKECSSTNHHRLKWRLRVV